MATPILNTFSSWELTDLESLQGSVLTITQIQVIQNQLAAVAEEKLNMEFDPANFELYVRDEAYKRGQLDILQFLLDSSVIAADELAQ